MRGRDSAGRVDWRGGARGLVLWGFLLLVCLGLGYPTLSRYDARDAGLDDAAEYYRIVEGTPQDATRHWRYRVLTPYVAKPFYWLAEGRVGTWDAVAVGLLAANALFTASAALLLVWIGRRVTGNAAVGLLGAAVYLLNFTVPQSYLAGLVDASEGFFFLLLTWLLYRGQWWPLPLVMALGVTAKETFLPLGVAYAAAWWLVRLVRGERRQLLLPGVWIIAMGLAGVVVIALLRWAIGGELYGPWTSVTYAARPGSYLDGLMLALTDRGFWFALVWLLPLGLWGLRYVRAWPWVAASLATALLALHLGVFSRAGGNVARPIFSVAGPLLSLATALVLVRLSGGAASSRPGAANSQRSDQDTAPVDVREVRQQNAER